MKQIQITVEFKDHDKVVLTNSQGDTYTSRSEELMDFLHGAKPLVSGSLPQGNVAILTTALRHVAEWSEKEEDMWGDPGYCAIEALKNYEASKRQ